MQLNEIVEVHRKFAKRHGWEWEVDDEKAMWERIKYLAIAINGEAGEFANVIKKVLREDFPVGKLPDKERMDKLKDEVVDIFIYTVLLSIALKMDLEAEHEKKLGLNEQKFREFERQ